MSEPFDGTCPTGLPVYYYPGGYIDEKTNPRIGFVKRGSEQGVVDLNILPVQDGAVDDKDGVWHLSDRRVMDSFGVLSNGAKANGCWDFTPWSRAYLDSIPREMWDTETEKKKRKAAQVKAKSVTAEKPRKISAAVKNA